MVSKLLNGYGWFIFNADDDSHITAVRLHVWKGVFPEDVYRIVLSLDTTYKLCEIDESAVNNIKAECNQDIVDCINAEYHEDIDDEYVLGNIIWPLY